MSETDQIVLVALWSVIAVVVWGFAAAACYALWLDGRRK